MNTSVVDKWAGCIHSVAFGFGGEDGHELREEGFNENYGCLFPEVVKNAINTGSFMENGETVLTALLYKIGKFNDPEVVSALEKTCGCCRYYQRR